MLIVQCRQIEGINYLLYFEQSSEFLVVRMKGQAWNSSLFEIDFSGGFLTIQIILDQTNSVNYTLSGQSSGLVDGVSLSVRLAGIWAVIIAFSFLNVSKYCS